MSDQVQNPQDDTTLARLERGSYQHARRREHEMAAASDLLDELSVPPRVARASQRLSVPTYITWS